MRVTAKAQVTIPKDVRERAGIAPGDEVEFGCTNGVVTIRRVERRQRPGASRGEKIVGALRGSRTRNRTMSTDAIMQLLRGDG
jgi:AbrB family looped-hinge helix DNA binding protein